MAGTRARLRCSTTGRTSSEPRRRVSRLSVKVIPKASSTRIVGWLGEALKVAVTVAPEGGRANAAVCELLASSLGVATSRVRCVSGRASSRKVFEIDELDEPEVTARLGRLVPGPPAPSPKS